MRLLLEEFSEIESYLISQGFVGNMFRGFDVDKISSTNVTIDNSYRITNVDYINGTVTAFDYNKGKYIRFRFDQLKLHNNRLITK